MIKVFCIIVSYNAMPWIERCLLAIGNQAEVIMVDNNSKDETIAFVNSNFPNVLIFPQSTNLGFGKANNLGVSEGLKRGATHVFLINQDVYIQPNTVSELVAFNLDNPTYGLLSPIHYNGKSTELDFQFSKYITNSPLFTNQFFNKEANPKVLDVFFINAAAWLVSKACLSKVGGFDPMFFHYGEDENYCQRARFHNIKIGVINSTFISHDREERESKPKIKFTDRYYTAYKKFIGLKYANINMPFKQKEYRTEFFKALKNIVKSLVKLNFKEVKGYYKKLSLAKQTKKEILNSRFINKSKGFHYIS
ncbi:MAG: glycosyltransferase family 2 protein [Algibacter sp.]|uniref:glycosyltransferase family 2 protein n=1 Tax=Algibacter sp. TaxID=1872428 RepID=UPI003296C267